MPPLLRLLSQKLKRVVAEAAEGAEIVDETVVVSEEPAAPADTVEANPELIAAAVAAPVTTDPAPTAAAPVAARKAQVYHLKGHSKQAIDSVSDMETKLKAAFRSGGDAEVFEFPVWDRAGVGEANILKSSNSAAVNDRIMGVTDASGNPLVGVRDFRSAAINRAANCDDCDNILETPDCFATYPESLGAVFQAIPADTCAWNVRKQQTLADLDQQVYVYCGTDAAGNPSAGIMQPDGTVVAIDAADESTWKSVVEIKTTLGPKSKYSLEEFPLLFTVDRDVDFCSDDGEVTRTLNRYFALQSRFMEDRKLNILRSWGLDNGFAAELGAKSDLGMLTDMSLLLNTIAGVIQNQAGVDALEGYYLAVPGGMSQWVNAHGPVTQQLSDNFGLAGIVEVGGTGPYADAATYPITPGSKLTVDAAAELLKSWEFVAFDPTQWRKPVGETVRIGVNDTFRDFNLARQNKRGIVVYRDETLIPVGCVPSVCLDAELCNVPLDPARSTKTGC